MLDQVFDSLRTASESSVQMQQEMFKQWTRQWSGAPVNAAGVSAEWVQKFQKGWIEFATDSLNKHRKSLDSVYSAGIGAIEQTFRLSEAKTPEDYRRLTEELWRKLYDTFKDQSETQLRDFQKSVEKLFELVPKPKA